MKIVLISHLVLENVRGGSAARDFLASLSSKAKR